MSHSTAATTPAAQRPPLALIRRTDPETGEHAYEMLGPTPDGLDDHTDEDGHLRTQLTPEDAVYIPATYEPETDSAAARRTGSLIEAERARRLAITGPAWAAYGLLEDPKHGARPAAIHGGGVIGSPIRGSRIEIGHSIAPREPGETWAGYIWRGEYRAAWAPPAWHTVARISSRQTAAEIIATLRAIGDHTTLRLADGLERRESREPGSLIEGLIRRSLEGRGYTRDIGDIDDEWRAAEATWSAEVAAGRLVAAREVGEPERLPAIVEETIDEIVTGETLDALGGTWGPDDYQGGDPRRPLNFGHSARKLADSVVAPLVAAARGYRTYDWPSYKAMRDDWPLLPAGNTKQGRHLKDQAQASDVLVMPWYLLTEADRAQREERDAVATTLQYRPAAPRQNEKGKDVKYEFVAGQDTPLGLHPAIPREWIDEAPRVLIAEGLLKGDAALSAYLLAEVEGLTPEDLAWTGQDPRNAQELLRGLLTSIPVEKRVLILTIAGVGNWRKNPEWRTFSLKNREVLIGVDGDVTSNRQVYNQVKDLWALITETHRGRAMLLAPPATDAEDKPGIDDYLREQGEWTSLMLHAVGRLPDVPVGGGAEEAGQYRAVIDREGCRMVMEYCKPETDESGRIIDARWGPERSLGRKVALGCIVEVCRTETHVDGYGRARVRGDVLYDLRVTLPSGTTQIVRGWPDAQMGDLRGILRQAGAEAVNVEDRWTTYDLHRGLTGAHQLAARLREFRSDDHEVVLVINRTGLVRLDGATTPHLDPETERPLGGTPTAVWGWVAEGGAIGPDAYLTPAIEARIDGRSHPIPPKQAIERVVGDIRTFVDTVIPAYNDPTSLWMALGRAAYAVAGARPRGSLLIRGRQGRGKSQEAAYLNAWGHGPTGDAESLVGNTVGYMRLLADYRDDVTTVIDDLKRVPGDDKTGAWDTLLETAAVNLRRGHDGPSAARGTTDAKGTGVGERVKGAPNPAWPTVVMYGENNFDLPLDSSTAAKIISYEVPDDFIKPRQASEVIARYTAEGLPRRLSRSYTSWLLTQIPEWVGESGTRDDLTDYWANRARTHEGIRSMLDGEQIAAADAWIDERSRDTLNGVLDGLRLLREWMLAAIAHDTSLANDDRAALAEKVTSLTSEGAVMAYEAASAWRERLAAEGGVTDPRERILEAIRQALAMHKCALVGYNNFDYNLPGNTGTSRAPVIGKAEQEGGPVYLVAGAIAPVIGATDAEVKAALRSVCTKTAGGEHLHRPRINGVKTWAYRLDRALILGGDEDDDETA